jgi:dynein light chain LC8-type
MTTLPTPLVKSVGTMSKELELEATKMAHEVMERVSTEQAMAHELKDHFDRKYGPTWHCFVGRNFGSFVTHQTGHYIYFYVGQMGFLLFKSG